MGMIGRRKRPRWLVVLALLIAAAVGVFLVYYFGFTGNGSDEAALSTYRVTTATIRFNVTTSGEAKAADESVLSFGMAGRVSSVEVKLSDEVKTDQKLASLESDALNNQLATAEANLLSARIRLQQIQKEASDADKAAAEKAVVTAQVALDTALNDQKDLLEGASDAELAAAEERVRSAESAILTAQNNLRKLQEGPSEADLAAAEANVASAQANLTSARSLKTSAEASVQSTEVALHGAATNYCDTEGRIDGICDDFSIPFSNKQISDLNDSVSLGDDDDDEDEDNDDSAKPALVAATNTLVQANSAYSKALTAKEDAKAAVSAAEAALTSAQQTLDALEEEPDAEDIAAAEAAVTAAEQALKAAQLQLEDLREGATDSAIAAAQGAVDTARVNLSAATAARGDLLDGASQEDIDFQVQQVRVAEVAVEQARHNLEDATLVAPFDGTVAAITISVGDLITSATPAMTLLTPNALEVELTLGETDLPSIRVGQKGVIIFDAIQEQAYQLTVTEVGLAPTTQQGVVTYLATAQLTNFDPNADVRPAPGMSGSAVIATQEKTGVLAVPNRAIKRQGEDQIVQVVIDGKLETRTIRTGITDGEKTEILSGLKEGDQVVVPGGTAAEETTGQGEELPGGIR
ncbi:MAG: efflux RND transporter periplasmic adaptor subunit [Dehalococcoidia bacterium]|nr:efflux RND transporter periplasmic adaptor subunit [Dehalococcoidia bacterium]